MSYDQSKVKKLIGDLNYYIEEIRLFRMTFNNDEKDNDKIMRGLEALSIKADDILCNMDNEHKLKKHVKLSKLDELYKVRR